MVSRGKCMLCDKEITTSTALRHFKSCDNVKDILNGEIDGYIISIKDKYSSDYWLYIAVPSSFTLEDLDNFLRDIWVECCGHLSEFVINGVHYGSAEAVRASREFPFGPRLLSAKKKLSAVLSKGLIFDYIYDFGSSTELILAVVDNVKLKDDDHIYVLGRNNKPNYKCVNCDNSAEYICYECLGEMGELTDVVYCRECLMKHDHADDNAGLIPNSPRAGVCGYTGDEKMEKLKIWPIESDKSLRISKP